MFEAFVSPCGEEGTGPLDYSDLDSKLASRQYSSDKETDVSSYSSRTYGDLNLNTLTSLSSLSENKLDDILLYPNPVVSGINLININSKLSVIDVDILSIDGTLMYKMNDLSIHNGGIYNQIFVDFLSHGIYFIKISDGLDYIKILKFIKN